MPKSLGTNPRSAIITSEISLYFFIMKSILVATDFSQSADNAMNYAASLALNLGANLILLHVYQIPISMSDVPVLMVSAEELRNNADMGLKKSREITEKS